ncbi:type IX secretion system plug protein [Flavobacterium koreense]
MIMLKKYLSIVLFLYAISISFSQEKEVNPPYHIKTISFVQNGQNAIPLFQLGDSFQLQFDDLHGTEDNYYYKIMHCDYDWKQSQLSINEYLTGFDNQRIQDYTNSLNALQIYSHYRIPFPNKLTQLKVSGNYVISILNEDQEVVFSRKFIIYEPLVSVPMQVKRARNVKDVEYKHNIDFAIKSNTITFQSPLKNVKVLLMQNGKFNNAISDIKPMYTIGNDLIYKYDSETQFWAGNEYLFFENKNIRAANNSIARIDTEGGLYNCFLYTSNARAKNPYTYWPDINGNFSIKNISAENDEIEADYAWIYFSLSAPSFYQNKDIFITGMFNNYALTDENKMEYNVKKGIYEKALMIKQGFTNFNYTIADKSGKVDEASAIDGNFYQTENNYFAIIYYRENNQRYDRVIGKGVATSTDIIN